jgi:subtilisin family serine protease
MRPFLFLVALLIPTLAQAQSPELIVRVSSSTDPVARYLDQGGDLQKNAPASMTGLFDGVTSARPVVQRHGTAKSSAPSIPAYVLGVQDSSSLATIRKRWQNAANVEYVQENFDYFVETRADPRTPSRRARPAWVRTSELVRPQDNTFADSLDHLDVIRARDAQTITRGIPGVRIGIIDTGIDLGHPDLDGQSYINAAEDINGNGRFDPADLNGVDDDGNGYVDDVAGYDFVDRPGLDLIGEYVDRDPDATPDTSGRITSHGTFVAGVTSGSSSNEPGSVLGVAPGARYVSLRAFGADGRGQTDDIAAALTYAADLGLEVVNLSFGRDRPSPLLEEAVRYANDRGVTIVASAGNQSTDRPHYPSDYPEVISVMWLAEDGEGLPDVLNQSQYGIGVDIGAPGTDVFTTRFPTGIPEGEFPEVDDLYTGVNGSSFAAPQVAGAAALLLSQDPSLSPSAVRSILLDTATDLQEPGWDHLTAGGLVNAFAALQRAIPAAAEISFPAFNDGFVPDEPLVITGTAINPGFESYALFWAEGTQDFDQRFSPWTPITPEPVEIPVIDDTLGVWNVQDLPLEQLPDGEYTLRLVLTKRDGSVIEDRRRLYLDRTPPVTSIRSAFGGLIRGDFGVLVDAQTDDVTQAEMTVALNGEVSTVGSEYEVRRHALRIPDATGRGGRATVTVTATNPAGLRDTTIFDVDVPARSFNRSLFTRELTSVPPGRILPSATDFDDDGLLEVVVNPRRRGNISNNRGSISDTLRSFEWAGSSFLPADTVLVSVIPRDVGDADNDGLTDLLTQVRSITLMLEQPSEDAFPGALAYIDTTGIADSDGENALYGALLSDTDDDGFEEIIGHNTRQWRFLEPRGGSSNPGSDSSYVEVFRLDNPTGVTQVDSAALSNRFGPAIAADGDFDGDGRTDLLVGDRDGDLIVYESDGPNSMRVAWTDESAFIDAGDRMTTGDFDGDGRTEFVTFRQNYPLTLENGEQEPDLGLYEFWDGVGDDDYALRGQLPIAGEVAPDGAVQSGDFDGDGRDEVAISHPPELFIADFSVSTGWQVVYYDDGTSVTGKVLSASMVAADFDGDGTSELLASTEADSLVRYRYQSSVSRNPPPQWVRAQPLDETRIRLQWQAAGADSVTVFDAPAGSALDPVATTTDSTRTLLREDPRSVALRAWYAGAPSPLTERREVRPHAPATVTELEVLGPVSVRLQFSEPLSPTTRAEQFAFESSPASGLTFAQEEKAVVLRFDDRPSSKRGSLTWTGVRDATGLAVAQTSVDVTFPEASPPTFLIRDWEILNERQVEILFSRPLDAATADDPDRYRVTPSPARVEEISFQDDAPDRVQLTIGGVVIGATGQSTLLTIDGVTSRGGEPLAKKSRTIRLTEPADGLDDVFVYPNPYRGSQHGNEITIGGLPVETQITILSPDGRLVRKLSRERSNGGRTWDLRDVRGERVPSGIYVIRVESPSDDPVIRRAAVVW